MKRLHLNNAIVLVFGIGISATGAFLGDKGVLLRQGGPLGLGGFLAVKAASSLPCRISDVLIVAAAFCLIMLAKTIDPTFLSPLLFEVPVIGLVPIYWTTGLTFRMIDENRRPVKK